MSDEDRLDALRSRVRLALNTLPMDQRATYLLSSLDGLDHEAIAFRLGFTVVEVEAVLAMAIVSIDREIRKKISH